MTVSRPANQLSKMVQDTLKSKLNASAACTRWMKMTQSFSTNQVLLCYYSCQNGSMSYFEENNCLFNIIHYSTVVLKRLFFNVLFLPRPFYCFSHLISSRQAWSSLATFGPAQFISSFHPSAVSSLSDQINKWCSRKQICALCSRL